MRVLSRVVASLAVGVVSLAVVSAAPAASPVKGGRYEGRAIALTISDSGRGMSPQGFPFVLASEIDYPACGRRGTATILLATNEAAAPLVISADGHFRMRAKIAAVVANDPTLGVINKATPGRTQRVTLSGRFVSRRRAVGQFRVETISAGRRVCATRWIRFRDLAYTGEHRALRGSCAARAPLLASAPGVRLYEETFIPGRREGVDLLDAITTSVAVLCVEARNERRIVEVADSTSCFSLACRQSFSSWGTGPFAVSTRYVAAFRTSCVDIACGSTVEILDHSSLPKLDWTTVAACGGWKGSPSTCDVRELVVTDAGAVAWSNVKRLRHPDGTYTDAPSVAARMTDGTYAVFDDAAGVDVESLRLDGSTLSWTDAGEERSAVLR